MKLLTFTDVHCNKKALQEIKNKCLNNKPDLLVCCGDLSIFDSCLDQAGKMIDSLGIKTLMIPGNHETPTDIAKLSEKYKNIINLHQSSFELDNYIFFGYGTGGFSFKDEKFERIAKQFAKNLDRMKKFIFVVHAPVYNTTLDEISGEHFGCNSFRKFVEETEPKLVLCGHFHENEKKRDKIKNSLILNPGKFGMIIKI